MSDFNNTDDVNDLMPRVIDSTCWKDLDLDDCKERIAELERQRDYWQDAAKHKIGSIAKLEAKNRRLVELVEWAIEINGAEYDALFMEAADLALTNKEKDDE